MTQEVEKELHHFTAVLEMPETEMTVKAIKNSVQELEVKKK